MKQNKSTGAIPNSLLFERDSVSFFSAYAKKTLQFWNVNNIYDNFHSFLDFDNFGSHFPA